MRGVEAGLGVFVPSSICRLLEPGASPSARVRGTILFCDVAGFTPMTEALSVMGREGAERLTNILNGYFTRMISILGQRGGDVLRFGGDAMTVFFPEDDGRRAAASALEMMAAMGEFGGIETPAGTFSLSMKIGAASGEVLLGIVGYEGGARDYYAAGRPLDDAAEAEHHASPGLVVLHPSFSKGGGEGWKTAKLDGGFVALKASPEAPGHKGAGASLSEERLRAFVPSCLARDSAGGGTGEHRGTAVAFISISGLSWDDGKVHERVDELFAVTESAARKYGGTLNKLDMGDKGTKALLLFGAPLACEAREEMAARCVLEILQDGALKKDLVLKAGITSAPLFSGPVGSASRREFTVMGDGINLAARLMAAAAPGTALVSRAVAEAASAALHFKALDPVRVKGKAEPVAVFLLEGEKTEEAREKAQPLVGRDALLAELKSSLFGPRAKPLLVAGEAGSGKSALAKRLAAETRDREIPLAVSAISPYHASVPYGAWRPVALRLVGATRHDPAGVIAQARDAALAEEAPGFAPLLNPILGLGEELTRETKGLSPKEKRDASFAMFARLLGRLGERVVILDGLSWADALSLELLESLLDEAERAPWRIVLFTRPSTELQERLAPRVEARELAPLSPEEAGRLLEEACGLEKPSEPLLRWFMERRGGNPGTALALVEALRREKLISAGIGGRLRIDEDRLFAAAFPGSLEALYLRNVEALGAEERLLLREAAILGYSVSAEMLRHVSGLEGEVFEKRLGALERGGFLAPAPHGARPYKVFADPLLQAAVYEAAPFETKRETHLKALDFLEALPEASSPSFFPVLARHAEGAGDAAKAKRYHRLAGRDAAKRFDNAGALEHLEYTCRDLTADHDDIEDAFSLMEAYNALGKIVDYDRILASLLPLVPMLPSPHRGRLGLFRAQQCWRNQRWADAEAFLLASKIDYQSARDWAGVGKTLVNLAGGVYGPTGQLEKAKACLEEALVLPKGKGQAIFRAMALANLGLVAWREGNMAQATSRYVDALSSAKHGNLPRHEAIAAANLLSICYEQGHYVRATRVGGRALVLSQTLALRELERQVASSLALAWTALGQLDMAEEAAGRVRAESYHEGNVYWQALATQTLGHIGFLKTEYFRAFLLSNESKAGCENLGEKRHKAFVLFERLRQFSYLGLKEKAESEVSAEGGRTVFSEATVNERPLQGLCVLLGESPEKSDLMPDAKLLLWSLNSGAPPDLRGESLSHEEKVRWIYSRIATGDRSASTEGWSLLRKAPAGVWGLRLWGLLYQNAMGGKPGARAAKIRQEGLAALYYCRANSPDWVWEKIAAFPEIKALIKGRPEKTKSLS